MSSIIKQLPTVALRGLTILPGMVAHFDVSREKSIKAVEEAMMDEQEIFLLTQKKSGRGRANSRKSVQHRISGRDQTGH